MKRIVSISIGSSQRDHQAQICLLGEDFSIERIGTDGDIEKAIRIISELDGKVDAFGMGGIDLYLYGGNGKKYTLKAALPIAQAAQKTPIVDGSGLKNTLERRVISYLDRELGIPLAGKKVFLVCAMDRFGMAEEFEAHKALLTYGDMMFALGLPIPISSLNTLRRIAAVLMPLVSNLPFEMLYPTGKEQEKGEPKYQEHYQKADIIAGDYLYIKKHLPPELHGKIIVTNTVTGQDVDDLKERGLSILVTSTPEIKGRSFGTNVMEAVFISLLGKRPEQLLPGEYDDLIDQLPAIHRVVHFEQEGALIRNG